MDAVILPILESGLFILAVGVVVPAAYTALTLPFLYSYMIPESNLT